MVLPRSGTRAFFVALILIAVFVVLSISGWVHNLFYIVHLHEPVSQMTAWQIVRVVGIPVIPIGVIAGWIG